MNNLAQLLLTVVIITLTLLLVVVGVQVMLVLSEARGLIRRMHGLLDSGKHVSEVVGEVKRFFHRSGTPLKK